MNIESLKSAASGNWPAIISSLAGVDASLFDGRHHACPSGRCGSTKDGFRVFDDFVESGGCVCASCDKFGDGLATLQWLLGCDFKTASAKVADYLGGDFSDKKTKSKPFRPPIDCITLLEAPGTREAFAREFCRAKPGIVFESLWRCKWAPAVWPRGGSHSHKVIAFVTHRLPSLAEHSFILYRKDGKPFPPMGQKLGERKAHILGGRATGNKDGCFITGTVEDFEKAKRCFKCEGITDAVAMASILGSGEIAIANICGADSCEWVDAETFNRFEEVVIVADNDPSGVGLAGAHKFAGVLL